MKTPAWLPEAVMFVGVGLITLYFWSSIYNSRIAHLKNKGHEGFLDSGVTQQVGLITSEILTGNAKAEKEVPPTDQEMALAYRKMLVYISNNFSKGLVMVYDLNDRVYGRHDKVPDNFDPRKLMDNFKNPITGI
jgi:hypothetical protein